MVHLLGTPAAGGREPTMSPRRTATAVGILFVTQMVTAVAGTTLIQAFVDGGPDESTPVAGVLLMVCSGLAVVAIGLLMYPVLRKVDRRLAVWYPILRGAEFVVSTACGIYLLARSEVVPNHLLWVYVPTAAGGLIFTYLLFTSRLVPQPIALLGLVGYACLGVGVPLDLMGALDMDAGAGQALLVPGGLFEAVALPLWLIAKGFRAPPSAPGFASPALGTTG
jgi:hypothetical protein